MVASSKGERVLYGEGRWVGRWVGWRRRRQLECGGKVG